MFEAQEITLEAVHTTAQKMLHDGWRFVTQTAVDRGEEGMQLLYHYDRDEEMQHFRLKFQKGDTIPSISDIYFAALLVENENRDLLGLSYQGLVLDFNRTLYLEEAGDPMQAPFCKISTFTKMESEG